MTYFNLSKIKTKFRTTGNITGNFGAKKPVAGSPLNEIGMTTKETIKCATQSDYLHRLYDAFDNTEDAKLKKFLYQEIRKILITQGKW